ncbi:hypothetical protein GOP47_0022231 [Adiantum capillus-veneris]|uniref:Uncharacterized protein n=1 Tax=Adiantum capillus-veneris TaxID=13818 RepID=A0A9D4Z6X2_ADICA|nr:hypothetical protein GOP47_0022231 [Adiantum capillus-veneris]
MNLRLYFSSRYCHSRGSWSTASTLSIYAPFLTGIQPAALRLLTPQHLECASAACNERAPCHHTEWHGVLPHQHVEWLQVLLCQHAECQPIPFRNTAGAVQATKHKHCMHSFTIAGPTPPDCDGRERTVSVLSLVKIAPHGSRPLPVANGSLFLRGKHTHYPFPTPYVTGYLLLFEVSLNHGSLSTIYG